MTNGRIAPQNLVRQVSSESLRLEPGFYKRLAFDGLTIASAAGTGFIYSGFLDDGFSFAALLAAAAVFAVFSALELFFTRSFGRRAGVIALELAAFFAPFYRTNPGFLAIAAAAMLVLLLWGEILGRIEIGSSLEIRFAKSAHPVLAKLTTALILVFIVLYAPRVGPDNVFVSRESFGELFGWASGLVGGLYPDVRLDSTFSDLAKGIAKTQLQKDRRFAGLPPSAQAEVLQETAVQVSRSLGGKLGLEIKPDRLLGETAYDLIANYLGGLASRYGNFFRAGWVIAVFLVLRGFGIIFYWIAGLLAFVTYQALLASGIVHITGETRTKEIIEW